MTSRRKNRDSRPPVVQSQFSAARYSGPIPPAAELEKLEAIERGLADRVVRMAEANAAHRQEIEKRVVNGNVDAQRRGQWMAYSLALVVAGLGAWLVMNGRTSVGLWVVFGDIVLLASTFLGARWMQRRERIEKSREVPGRPRPG